MSDDLYDILGVGKDATANHIKKAFRRKAMVVHPDRGGSNDDFAKVQQAMDVLSDPSRRQKYDQSGVVDDEHPDNAAMLKLQTLISQAIQQKSDPAYFNPVDWIKRQLKKEDQEITAGIQDMRREAVRLEKLIARATKKNGGTNLVQAIAKQRAEQMRAGIVRAEQEAATNARILEMIEDYQYQVDERPAQSGTRTLTPFDISPTPGVGRGGLWTGL